MTGDAQGGANLTQENLDEMRLREGTRRKEREDE
jgi:hypothetical protein